MVNTEIRYNEMHDGLIEFFGKMFWIQDLAKNGITKPDEKQISKWMDVYNGRFTQGDRTVVINTLRARTQKAAYSVMQIVQLNIVFDELPKKIH